MRPLVFVACVAGCTSTGSLNLTLQLPSDEGLAPQGETTVTVIATGSDGSPTTNTAVLDGSSFSAGEFPVEDGVKIDVLLRDVSSRLVGVGESSALVDIKAETETDLTLPVRKPFVYATTTSTSGPLIAYDPTLDSRDANFQTKLDGITGPMFAVSAGGDRLAVVGNDAVQVIDTSTNQVIGDPINLPDVVHDATSVPGSHRIAVGTEGGISIVDLDKGTVTSAATAAVQRVTVGLSDTGGLVAYGLVSRVAPPVGPLDSCGGSSQLVAVDVENPTTVEPTPIDTALSDIAADPTSTALFATAPCDGQVVRLDGSSPTEIAPLERAAVLTVLGGRVWAAGSHASTPTCFDDNGKSAPCADDSDISCPTTSGPVSTFVAYVTEGAHLIVASIPTSGSGDPVTFDVPDRRETIVSTDDDAQQHAQVLRAFGTEPLDLVALPGGQFVGVVTTSNYFIQQLVATDQFGDPHVVLPCLSADTSDWLLLDMASVSIASRVRTRCELAVGDAEPPFQNWACDAPAANETSKFGDFTPSSVGALFGAR